jgi:MerC mercury resistance protein
MAMGTSAPTSSHFRPSLDAVGATASLACAVHCAVVALLLGGLPAASFFAAPWIDWAFLGASLLIGLVALVPGYRRHRQRAPLMLFSAGIALLLSLRSMQVPPSVAEMTLVVVAASLLVAAHWRNRGALHSCACGPRHH